MDIKLFQSHIALDVGALHSILLAKPGISTYFLISAIITETIA